MGPITGISAYPQSLGPLPFIGSKKCMILGPKSLAGLIAQPVGPPNPKPIPATNKETGKADMAPISIPAGFIKKMPSRKTQVAMVSTNKFCFQSLMDGPVEKKAS